MNIKKFGSIIWKILAGIVVVFSFIEFILKWKILKAIKDFFVQIWGIKIPDILLLILILGILVWLYLMNKKVRGVTANNIKQKPPSFNKLRRLPKFPEYTSILFVLGEQHDHSLSQNRLSRYYCDLYKEKGMIDFNTTINYLKTEEYITSFYDDRNESTSYDITSKGLALMEKVREG